MFHKSFELLDAKADVEAGTFEATVAVFGNVDRGGDRILPGAFAKTLESWAAAGDPIPVILSHQWDNPMAHIGVVEDAKETDQGLWVKGRLDVDDNDVARQVHRLMARRSLKEFSFGYDVPKGGMKRAKDGANDLTEINLAEVGPTLKGMNPDTELHGVKSAMDANPETADAEGLRKQASKVAREVEQQQIPDVPEQPKAPAEPEIDLTKELQEVKARLDTLEKALEDQEKKKADGTDKEPQARSVDPLRKQAEAFALEVASGGLDQLPLAQRRKPAPEPDLMDLSELKRRSRDLMLQVLSGEDHESL